MKFCSHCGAEVSFIIPTGDNLKRHVCNSCDTIHYQNPRIIAGYIPYYEDKVLLCKRAIEPRHGFWTLPAGFLENHETVSAGAARESLEEANASIKSGELFATFSLPHISQVYIFYRGELKDLNYSAGEESLEVELFKEGEIPWDELAFPSITKALKYYFADRAKGEFTVHDEDLIYPPRQKK